MRCSNGITASSSADQAARESGSTVDGGSILNAQTGVFGDEFLLERPLLQAIRSKEPVVLLLDEVDRVDVETEALFLEVLSEFQVSVPELGTVRATTTPLVLLTSNASRQLSEALKRRCLYLHLDYPDAEREQEIVRSHVPEVEEQVARSVVELVSTLRRLDCATPVDLGNDRLCSSAGMSAPLISTNAWQRKGSTSF